MTNGQGIEIVETTRKPQLKPVLKTLVSRAKEWFQGLSPFVRLNLLATMVGIIGGLGAWIFRLAIQGFFYVFYQLPISLLNQVGQTVLIPVIFLMAPVLGGLFVGILVSRVSREVKGHGVPEVLESVALHGGRMKLRVPFVKIVASAATLGSGGSAGREGPIAQIGAGFAALVGEKLELTTDERQLLVISGVAAGISATFNAPIGGSLFAIEVLTKGTQKVYFLPIMVAAVVGTVVGQLFLGDAPAFVGFPPLQYHDPTLIPLILLLGIVCGILSAAWIKFFYFFEDTFEGLSQKIKMPHVLEPAIGGLGIGLILMLTYLLTDDQWETYTVMGRTYLPMDFVFQGKFFQDSTLTSLLFLLMMLFLLKIIATSLTIGTGGSGGVFAPTLFLGVMLGAMVGIVLNLGLGFSNADIVLFAVIGMAAFFAGTGRAPLTAILMTAEMTNDFFLSIPLMLAVSVSYLISSQIQSTDIYTLKLIRRGVQLEEMPRDILDKILVRDAMTPRDRLVTVDVKMRLESVMQLIRKTKHEGFPVFDNDDFIGVITLSDVQKALQEHPKDWNVKQVMEAKAADRPLIGISEDATLTDATLLMERKDVSRLPVLRKQGSKMVLIGWLTNHDITRCFVSEKARTLMEEESEKFWTIHVLQKKNQAD